MTAPEPLSPRAQALLDAARDASGPDDAAIARMRARIAGGAAGGVGVAAATKVGLAGGLAGGVSGATKLALVMLAVAAIGGGAWWITRGDEPPGDRVQPAAKVAVQPSATARPAVPPADLPPISAPTRSARPDDPPPDVAAEPSASAPRRTPPAARDAKDKQPTLADEVALVDDAMAALRQDDAAAALAAADDHVTRFGGKGQLAEEAAAIRVEALCKLGDSRWAFALDNFDARWPRSAQRPKLTAACKGVQ